MVEESPAVEESSPESFVVNESSFVVNESSFVVDESSFVGVDESSPDVVVESVPASSGGFVSDETAPFPPQPGSSTPTHPTAKAVRIANDLSDRRLLGIFSSLFMGSPP